MCLKMCLVDQVISLVRWFCLFKSSTIPSQLGIVSIVSINFVLYICQYHDCHLVISCELSEVYHLVSLLPCNLFRVVILSSFNLLESLQLVKQNKERPYWFLDIACWIVKFWAFTAFARLCKLMQACKSFLSSCWWLAGSHRSGSGSWNVNLLSTPMPYGWQVTVDFVHEFQGHQHPSSTKSFTQLHTTCHTGPYLHFHHLFMAYAMQKGGIRAAHGTKLMLHYTLDAFKSIKGVHLGPWARPSQSQSAEIQMVKELAASPRIAVITY